MKKLFLLFCCIPLFSCAQENFASISLVDLIVYPEKYKNAGVSVVGYYTILGGLYLTKDHAEMLDSASSVSIQPESERDHNILLKCTNAYAHVEGVVQIDRDNFVSIRNIKRVRCNGSSWYKLKNN